MSDAQQPLNALPKGHRLQEYELVRVLGMGGFGMTYLGYDHNLDKGVAIKEYLPSDLATRTTDGSVAPQASQFRDDFQWGLERFLDEARALARFDHRHIVKVYRFFEAHGTAYIVMEYAEGDTLSEYLEREGPLREGELKKILYPILAGVAVVHEANFLHRDIKPGNIIIRSEDGSPVLLDFGAARQAIGAKSRSITSVVTPGYAPIEQYSSRGNQGPWTDIYALGAVCYRALTGEVPEDATDRVLNDSLVAVSQRCADRARGTFLAAIDGALLVNGVDRPQSVAEWREALEADGGEAPEQAAAGAEASQSQEKPLLSAIDGTLSVDAEDRPPSVAEQVPKRADEAEVQQDETDAPPIVRRVEPAVPLSEPQKKSLFKWLTIVLGIIAVLVVGSKMYVDHAEQVALDKQRQEQVAEEARLAAEQAEKQRQKEQAALEKQRQEQVFVAEVGREPSPDAVDDKGMTDLHHAARLNLPVLTLLLIKQGAAVDARDKYGRTPLFSAAEAGAFSVAELLLKQGADVNARNNFGYTPLFSAAEAGAFSVAELLLKQGADVNAKGTSGWTSLHMAARAGAFSVAELLIRYGADVNAKRKDVGGTPLHIVSHNMHRVPFSNASSVAELLLKQGADVNAKNYRSETPLHNAATRKDISVAEVLIRYGADVNAKDKNGWTPLHDAGWQRASSVAELLLRQGADVNAKDNDGKTPLRSAVEWDKPKIAELLRRYGGRE